MRLADFFTFPALVMFFLGVIFSMWVKSLAGRARSAVTG